MERWLRKRKNSRGILIGWVDPRIVNPSSVEGLSDDSFNTLSVATTLGLTYNPQSKF